MLTHPWASSQFHITAQLAGEGLAVLADLFRQIALHEAEPVAIYADLVFGIDGGDGILAVHDRRNADSTMTSQYACRIILADGRRRVDLDDQKRLLRGEIQTIGRLALALEANN